jgi:hypothetical protein
MSTLTDRLILMWSNPVTKANCKIGLLSKKQTGYQFRYLKDEVRSAYDDGFTNLAGFPDLEAVYQSPKLFSVFERRIPSPSRKEFKEVINRFQLTELDDLDWEYLRVSKGKLATDRLFFLEPIKIQKNVIHLEFEAAGWKPLNQEQNLIDKVTRGQQLDLLVEPDNPVDPKAIQLMTRGNPPLRIGYVPKPYNDAIHFWIQKNIAFQVEIRTLLDEKQCFRPVVSLAGTLRSDLNLNNFLPPVDEFIQKSN